MQSIQGLGEVFSQLKQFTWWIQLAVRYFFECQNKYLGIIIIIIPNIIRNHVQLISSGFFWSSTISVGSPHLRLFAVGHRSTQDGSAGTGSIVAPHGDDHMTCIVRNLFQLLSDGANPKDVYTPTSPWYTLVSQFITIYHIFSQRNSNKNNSNIKLQCHQQQHSHPQPQERWPYIQYMTQ